MLAAFIENNSFSVIWEMFDLCSFEILVIVILICVKLFNECRRFLFVGGWYCHWAEFIETVNIEKLWNSFRSFCAKNE